MSHSHSNTNHSSSNTNTASTPIGNISQHGSPSDTTRNRSSSPVTDSHEEARLNADSDDGSHASQDPGKMFIGGLSWQTTAEGLRDYFSRFGEVNECMVMRDPATKRARGFGFITFVDPASVDKVLATQEHELDGKRIDPKVAFPKRSQAKMVTKTKKVFIGGLSATSTLEDMKSYFEAYGKVEDAMLMFDKATQRHRGFGFITFDNDEVADKVCEIHFHEINGKMVECKKAQPKEVMLPVQLNKSRAAAARNLYGLPPDQLLAYATYMPRFGATLGNFLYPGNAFNQLPSVYSGLNGAAGSSSRPPPQFDAGLYNLNGTPNAAGAQHLVDSQAQMFLSHQANYHGATHNKTQF
ncbi:unnamed protein product [Caenorhabditis bovis]|uniref:RRM domain-containing protein n=1 Tax=Caenorhabditis bovis TaxID=2654633 RepID=A0A8S1EQJ8_9PELO|nr:unnamed protein product [Caenorhabditis bovis]